MIIIIIGIFSFIFIVMTWIKTLEINHLLFDIERKLRHIEDRVERIELKMGKLK
jgi:hypothetical protein